MPSGSCFRLGGSNINLPRFSSCGPGRTTPSSAAASTSSHGFPKNARDRSKNNPSGAAIANLVELVQHIENILVLGGLPGVTEVLIGGQCLLYGLDDVVLRAAGRPACADQLSGRTGRGRDELNIYQKASAKTAVANSHTPSYCDNAPDDTSCPPDLCDQDALCRISVMFEKKAVAKRARLLGAWSRKS